MILGATIRLKDQFTSTMKQARQATEEMSKSMKMAGLQANRMKKDFQEAYEAAKPRNMFDSAKQVGAGMTAAGMAGAAALGMAAKSSIEFESAFAGVRKTVDASEEEFAAMRNQIRAMTRDIPAVHEEIAGVAEAAGQLGIQKEAIMGFTRTMIDLGVATNMTSDEAATALARFANITQMSAQDYDRLGATIVDLGNNLATTESEIVAMGLRLAGAGNQVGMSEAQIMSFSGALSSVGIAAEAGGTAFSKVMIDMASEVATNGKNLQNFAKVSGMSVAQFKKAYKEDASGAIISFIEGLGRMSDAGENVFGILDEMGMSEIRVRDSLLRASGAGDLFRKSMETGTTAWEENVALTNEARERYKTTESQLKMLKNTVRDAGITMGDMLLPYIVRASQTLKGFIGHLDKISPEMKKMIAVTLIAATGFLLLGGPLLLLVGFLPSIAAGFAMLGTVSLGILGPIALAIAAVASAGYLLYKNWDKIKKKVLDLKGGFIDLKDNALKTITVTLNTVKDKLKEWQPVIETTAKILTVVFGPALIKTGVQAAITGTRVAVGLGMSFLRTAVLATWLNGVLLVDLVKTFIRTGARAAATAAVMSGQFVLSLIKTGAQAVATSAIITGQLIISMAQYALSGWRAVTAIGATVIAWGIQKGAMLAGAAVTGIMTAAQWALNMAMMAAPYMWIIAAIAGVIAVGVLLYKNWDMVKEKAGSAFNTLKTTISDFATDTIQKFNDFKTRILKIWDDIKTFLKNPIKGTVNLIENVRKSSSDGMGEDPKGHAAGLAYVPYDRYPALLHKGESVLTRAEADQYRNQGTGITETRQETKTVNNRGGNNITININAKDKSVKQIINELVPALELALANT